MPANPLKTMALKWYGGRLSAGRARKLDRVWSAFITAISQRDLFR